jgi:prophage tail gpP-like protein
MRETVTLAISGIQIVGWKSVAVTRSLKDASAAFALSLVFTDPDSGLVLDIQPDLDCEVSTRPEGSSSDADEIIVSGTTSDDDMTETGSSLSVTVNGKSHTQRLVKNSCVHETGRLAKLTPLQIAQTLAAPYDVDVISTVDTGDPISVFRLEPGESVFAAIERACRERGLMITDDTAGRLVLCRAGTARNDSIVYGGAVDVTKWHHSRSSAERYTEYRVIGQKAGNNQAFGDAVAGCVGVAYDKGWTDREHVLTIIADGEADKAGCQARAKWEAATRAGKSSTLSISVRGWRSPSGKLWKVNELVRVKYPARGIDRDLLISEIVYTQNDSGTTADITLSLPSSFSPEPPAKRGKSGDWVEDWGTT